MTPAPIPRRTNQATFDQLFAEGAEAVLAGSHGIEIPPEQGGRRWGVSALLRPDATAAATVEALARDAATVAGDGHWLTGATHSSHLTIRALEWPRPDPVPADDPPVRRYTAALHHALTDIGPLTFDITGLTLTRLSVMACALPTDDASDRLSAAYAKALGPDAHLETTLGLHRSIWYLNLLHFAAPIQHPQPLVDWVAARRSVTPIPLPIARVEVAEWRFTGSGMAPVCLAAVPMPAAS